MSRLTLQIETAEDATLLIRGLRPSTHQLYALLSAWEGLLPLLDGLADQICAEDDIPWDVPGHVEDIGQHLMRLSERINAVRFARGMNHDDPDPPDED